MAGEVRLTNLKQFRAALAKAEHATPVALTKVLRTGARRLETRARSHTSGQIAKGIRAFARGTTAGIRSTHRGAKAHEFVKPGQQFLRKSASGNVHWVRWRDQSPKGYAYRARDEISDDVGKQMLREVTALGRSTGFMR